jgi:hypothetical protein
MRNWRSLVAGFGVTTLVAMTVLSPPAAAVPAKTATGTVVCGAATGTVKFSPPITEKGRSNTELVTMRLKLSSCATSGSNVSGIRSARLKATMTAPTTTNDSANSCMAVEAGNAPVEVSIQWTATKSKTMVYPPPVTKSALFMTRESWNTASSPLSLTLPDGGNASASDGSSFPGSDAGAGSMISATLSVTGSAFAAVCASGTGHLSKSTVTGGSVTIG